MLTMMLSSTRICITVVSVSPNCRPLPHYDSFCTNVEGWFVLIYSPAGYTGIKHIRAAIYWVKNHKLNTLSHSGRE